MPMSKCQNVKIISKLSKFLNFGRQLYVPGTFGLNIALARFGLASHTVHSFCAK